AGDVDQDGVEELGELVGVGFQVDLVLAQVLGVDRLHPLLDAAQEGGRLVAGEIEAPVLPEVFEQPLELGIAGLLGPGHATGVPRPTRVRSRGAIPVAGTTWSGSARRTALAGIPRNMASSGS